MKKNLLRTLLLAVALLTGTTGAWADEINATLVHTASSACAGTAGVFTSTVDAENEHVNNANFGGTWAAAAYADFSFEIPAGHTVKSATLTFTGLGESRNTRNCDVLYVSADESLDYDALAAGDAKVDLSATKITSVSFPKGATATKEFTVDATDALNAMLEAGKNGIIFKFTGNPGGGDLKGKGSDVAPTLVITTVSASEMTSYTVKFVGGDGAELKEAVTYNVLIGNKATASAADMASFFNADKTMKYIYASGNEEITAAENAEENVITLVFREADKFSYVLNSSLGTTIAEGEDWEGEIFDIAYPRYLVQDGALYKSEAVNKSYLKTITLDSNGVEATVDYNATGDTEVVFLAEAEDIETLTVSSAANSNIRCSSGKCAYNAGDEDAVITTLPNGKYKLYTSVWGNADTDFTFKAGDDNIFTIASAGYINDGNSEEFELNAASTPITLVKTTNSGRGIDFVYIIKTGDAELIEVVNPATEVKTIAEMKAVEPGTKVNFVMDGVKVTACGMLGFNGFAALEDATGAIQVGSDMAGGVFIELGVSAGMALTGHVKGIYDVVNGVPTFDIAEDTGVEDELTATEATVEPAEATIAEVKNAESVSKYVILKDVKITVPEDGGMNIYTAAQGEETITVVDNIRDMMTYQTVLAQYMDEETGDVVLPEMFESVTAIVSVDATGAYVIYPTAVVAKEVAEKPVTWDFTKWSEETIANLAAEAATIAPDENGKYPSVTLWRTYEKNGGPTEADPDREGAAYWYGTAISESTGLTANGETIAETDGLLFNKMGAGSLAIAVNYPSTSLGTYAGPSYLWMGGKNNSFIIPAVKPGATIEMTLESHKPAEGRGVKLTVNGTEIGSGIPTTVEDFTWTVPASDAETVDVTVTNTNGCHIYRIYVSDYKTINTGINGINSNVNASVNDVYTINGVKVRAAGESLNGLAKGLYIVGGKKVVIK